MNVTCNKCGKKYVIADDKVAGKASVKIRCKQCQNLIAVAVGAASSPSGVASAAGAPPPPRDWEDEPTRAAPAPDFNVAWFAMIAGKQQGPFDIGSLQTRVTGGEITLRTYLWRPGMPDWKRASEVPEVSMVFAGVSVGAAATGPTQAAPETKRTSATRLPAAQRDVAVANEVPSPELTRGTGKSSTTSAAPEPTTPAAVALAHEPAPSGGTEPHLNREHNGVAEVTQAHVPIDAVAAVAEADADAAASREDAPGAAAASVEVPPAADPFAQLPAKPGEPAVIGEATQFFITKAGVHKRNPPWKIALFVFGAFGIIAGMGAILQTLNIVPKVTRTTDDGREVQESFFSAGGVSGLKEILTGEAQRRKEEAERQKRVRDAAVARAAQPSSGTEKDPGQGPEVPVPPKTKDKALQELYAVNELPTRGPKLRKSEEGGGTQPNASGLSQEAAIKVVADKTKAFQQCVDNALHRNPSLAVGNITIVLVVGPSGAVKAASVEPKKHEASDWAQCMVAAGKRIIFPASDGETQLELPFKVGVAFGP